MPDGSEREDGRFELVELQEEMERSFLEYSLSVIISRALPDARDGLKPVHRRILYSMFDAGYRPDRPHVKSAKVVGDVMSRFHPHGDAAIYDALVRMVQEFSLLHPLIDGHGNFGAPDPSTGPAASRYTECRLAPIALEMLSGIDEETVDFIPNYDAQSVEPAVLPSRVPNLLVNGSQGIAVGMATQIPSHNLGEVVDGLVWLVDHPEGTVDDLMRFIPGPDFPTGGLIIGRSGIEEAYRTGKGSVKLRAVASIEEGKVGSQIIVTELPYQSSVEVIAEKIRKLTEEKVIEGIRDLKNYSSGAETRFVIELKRDANPPVVLNTLYRLTPLEVSFPIQMLALVDGAPRMLNLMSLCRVYLDHQRDVVRRRSEFRLKKAAERLHIVEGLLRCLDMLDEVVAVIRRSEDRGSARAALMEEPFGFSEVQANHVLDMTLGRLTRLGREELEGERSELRASIGRLEEILASEAVLAEVVKEELRAAAGPHRKSRKTRFATDAGEFQAQDLISDDGIIVMITRSGYIKAVNESAFRAQGRGGRGVVGARVRNEDEVTHVIPSSMLSRVLIFSSRGRVYQLRGYEIPKLDRGARGTALVNLIGLGDDERVTSAIGVPDGQHGGDLVFVTRDGMIKRTALAEYERSRRDGLIAVGLQGGDELVSVSVALEETDVVVVTRRGRVLRFPLHEVRRTGRASTGVRAIRRSEADDIVGAGLVREGVELFLITSAGFGKRTDLASFSTYHRGGAGVQGMRLTPAKGEVVAAAFGRPEDEVLVVSSHGRAIRVRLGDVSNQGRYATGVKVMTLEPGEVVASMGVVQDGPAQ